MSSSHPSKPSSTYTSLKSHLQQFPYPITPPGKSHDPTLTALIADLAVHPTLEAALHLLNADLPSAHFLVRHMSSNPAVEGMLLHAILHRIEGDYDNNRAWCRDVAAKDSHELEGSGLLVAIYPPVTPGERRGMTAPERAAYASACFLRLTDDVEAFCRARKGDKGKLEARCKEEMRRAVEFCEGKFGTERWIDASEAWVRPSQEVRNTGNDMVSGHKGWRKF